MVFPFNLKRTMFLRAFPIYAVWNTLIGQLTISLYQNINPHGAAWRAATLVFAMPSPPLVHVDNT